MTQTVDYDIVGSYNNQRSSAIDAERSVNLFEYIDPLGKKKKTLINTSGLVDSGFVFGAETGGFRAQFVILGYEYLVIGSTFFRISPLGIVSTLGTLINTSSGYVGIDANTFQVIIVDGVNGYIWDTIATTFTMITDTAFPAEPIDVCYLDGFFVVANGNTNTFQLSMYEQGLVWGPAVDVFTADFTPGNNWLIVTSTANYQTGVPVTFSVSGGGVLPLAAPPLNATDTFYVIRVDATHIRIATSPANAIAGTAVVMANNGNPTTTITSQGQLQQASITTHPGTIVACRTLHRRLFLFSQNYTEVWENAGTGTNLPFRRNNSLLIEFGCPAVGSIYVGFDQMMFISQDRDGLGPVMQVMGTQPLPASTRALDYQLAQYAEAQHISDCRGFMVKENGIIFYRMNFTLANHTFVYNVTQSDPTQELTKFWHEEEILNGDRHPAQTHGYFLGKNYVGDYQHPILYRLDSDIYTNNLEVIRRMRITKAIVPPGYQRIRVDRLQIDLLQGDPSQLMPVFIPLSLYTENVFEILTEAGDPLLAEQELRLTNPQDLVVFLSISRDGGRSYGYRIRAPMGAVGERSFRTLWRKLGTIPRGQAFVAKFEFFDAVPFIVLGASWAIEVMPE